MCWLFLRKQKHERASQPAVFSLGPLLKAQFIRRENRFRAEVALQGQPVQVHVPNSGRMQELLVPGVEVWLRRRQAPAEKQPIPCC